MKRKVKVTITGEYEFNTKDAIDYNIEYINNKTNEQILKEMISKVKDCEDFDDEGDDFVYMIINNFYNIKVKITP